MANITQFCVNDDGYIIQDTVPRDEDGNVTQPLHMNAVEYDWELIDPMARPKYNFSTQLFEDEGIDLDYWINQMNYESDPILKDQYKQKAYLRLRLSAFYQLWLLEKTFNDTYDIINNLVNNNLGENSIVYLKSDDYIYKKSLEYPYTETQLTTKKANNIVKYIKENKIIYLNNNTSYFEIKSTLDTDNEQTIGNGNVANTGACYFGINTSHKVIYTNSSDNSLYYLNTNTGSEYQITPVTQGYSPCYFGCYLPTEENIGYIKASNNYLYKLDLISGTETQITDYIVISYCYINNNNIVIEKDSDNFLYKINLDTLVETQLTTSTGTKPCFIGNNKIIYTKTSFLFNYNIISNKIIYTKTSFLDKLYKLDLDTLVEEQLGFDSCYNSDYISNIYINKIKFNEYYEKSKVDIENFIKQLDNTQWAPANQIYGLYFSTIALRTLYGIYTPQFLHEIPNYRDTDRFWLKNMSEFLGEN